MNSIRSLFILALTFSFGVHFAHSQNLVPDGGFENWNGTSGNFMAPLFDWETGNGTPDHHHQNNPIGSNLTSADPNAILYNNGFTGDGAVYNGLGCLGLYKGNGPGGTKEWASTQLTSPLIQDSCYRVSFRIQNKKNQINFPMATNQWGVFFNNSYTPAFNPNLLDFNTVASQWVTCTQLIDDTVWHYIELIYTADAPHTHIQVGYVGNPSNAIENAWSQSGSVGFYVWLDDLVIEQISNCAPCPITITGQSSTNEICTGADGTFTCSATTTGPPITYELIDNNTSLPVASNSTGVFTGLSAGSYYVEVSDGVCSYSSNVLTIINDVTLPDPGNSTSSLQCDSGSPIDMFPLLGPSAVPGGTWLPATIAGGGMYDPTQDAPGNYTYTVTSACGSASANVNIILLTANDPTINDPGQLCVDAGVVTLSAASSGGTWSGPGVNSSTGDFNPLIAGPGMHLISYNTGGPCATQDDITITVVDSDNATIAYSSASYCSGDLNPTPTLTGSPGNFSISPSGVIDANTGEVDLVATGTGSYTISYTTNGACPITETTNIDIVDQVIVTIDQAGPFCYDDPAITLTVNQSTGTWSGTGVDPTTGVFTPFNAGVGSWEVIYEVTGVCGDSDTITIIVNDLPIADAGTDVTINQGGFTMLNGSGGTSYLWDPAGSLSADDISNPIATPALTTLYTLTVTDDNGCIATDFVTVNVEIIIEEDDLFVPSMFSPNGDNHNDFMVVEGTGLNQFSMRIFNRWGELVFESDDQSISWDGKHKGKELNTAVFTYMLTYTDNSGIEQVLSGNVTLVK